MKHEGLPRFKHARRTHEEVTAKAQRNTVTHTSYSGVEKGKRDS